MQSQDIDRRRYARHRIRIPLAVRPQDGNPGFLSKIGDLSQGGVSFASPKPMSEGTGVEIELPVNGSRCTLTGTVVSCVETTDSGNFRVGLCFTHPEMSFQLKLAEQVLRIVGLQHDLASERGAEVSLEEAAQYWVEQYAETFADFYPPV